MRKVKMNENENEKGEDEDENENEDENGKWKASHNCNKFPHAISSIHSHVHASIR